MFKRKCQKIWKLVIASLLNLKRNIWMSIIAITSTSVMLALVGLFVGVLVNTSKLTNDIENKVTINTYLATSTADNSQTIKNDQGQEVPNTEYQKIKTELVQIDGVKSVTWSSKDEQLKKLVKTMGKSWENISGDANPLHDTYIVKVNNPNQVKSVVAKIKKLNNIAKVNYGGETTDKIIKIANITKTWGLIGILILLFVAVFLISNTIRITIMARKEEIQITRLVGAKNSYIRLPFIFEGLWIGILGSVIPSILIGWVYNVIYATYSQSIAAQNLALVTPGSMVTRVILIMIITSSLIGAGSSLLAMQKYLKV